MAKRYTESDLEQIDQQWRALFESQDITYLLVENSIALRKTVFNALQAAGCENIAEAKDGMEAIMALRKLEGRPVIITELNLPTMDGLAMLKQLRSDDATKDIPVILTSAEGRKERIVQAIKYGVQGYIKKPFETQVLLAKLQELNLI